MRGAHVAAVKTAIFKEFGLQSISSSNKRKSAQDIASWKSSPQVKECYNKLYDDNYNVIEDITKLAFPSLSDTSKTFQNIYTYTSAICDIVLNPNYPDVECGKKPLERRYQKFKVCGYYLKPNLYNLKSIR